MTPKEVKDLLVEILLDGKAVDITVVDIASQTTIADYFVIATGRSTTQVSSLSERVEEKCEENGLIPHRKEGVREGRWVVMDFSSVILHIFNDGMRDFYNLEKLWGTGENVEKITE